MLAREGFLTDAAEEREGLERARLLFSALPTPAWEEDFSRVKEHLSALGLVGRPADEVRARLLTSPSLLGECVTRVRILDVNDEALRLHQARDKQELLGSLDRLIIDASRAALVAQFVAVATGQTEFAIDSKVRTLNGEVRDVHLRWTVAPGSAESCGRVLVSTLDITERKRAQLELTRSLREAAALHEFTKRCANLSLDALSQDLLEAAEQATQAELVMFFLATPDGLQLRSATSTCKAAKKACVARAACLCGLAMEGQPIFSDDLATDVRCTRPECKEAGMASFAALPLVFKNETIGVLGLGSNTRRDFASQAAFLASVASMMALSLRNALLHEQLAQHAQQLERGALALGESERRFRTVLESVALIGLLLDLEGRIVSCSDQLLALTGWTRAEVVGRDWFETFIPASERASLREFFLSGVARGEVARHHENELVTRDGQTRLIAWNNSFARDSQGLVTGVTSLGDDITERKRAEAEALRERNLNQAAIESLPGLFYVFDAEGRFVRWNRNFEVTSGYGEAVARMSPLDLFVEPDRTRVAERIAEGFANGESSLEANLVTKSGVSIPYFFTGRRFTFGERPCLVGMGIDLTRRRQLEEQLLQSQKMDAIGQLAGGIAHDFNNLLTVIQGNTALLKDRADEPRRLEAAHEIAEAAERAAGLTRQLLAFSRGQKLQRTLLDLNAVVAHLAQMLRRVLGEDVRLELRLASTPLLAHVDAGTLDQVLMNLAVNARHAMASGGVLTIETMAHALAPDELDWFIEAQPGRYVGLRVSDTGCGIRASDIPHVFEPFFTTREVGKGTGLGLSTVFGIVRQHAGTLRLTSEVGRGTTFEVLLPADASTAAPAKAAAPLVPTPQRGKESILVVEDEAKLRTLFTRVLAHQGYQVCEAGSGPEALRQWDEQGGRIELLVTDMLLPGGMSGAQIAVRLRAKQPALRVLYISGYTGSAVSQGLELVEGLNFLQKPFKPEALLEAVRRQFDAG